MEQSTEHVDAGLREAFDQPKPEANTTGTSSQFSPDDPIFPADEEAIRKLHSDLKFDASVSRLYCSARARHYRLGSDVITLIQSVAGSSFFLQLMMDIFSPDVLFYKVVTSIFIVLAIVSSVCRWKEWEFFYEGQYQKYCDILRHLERLDLTVRDLGKIQEDYFNLEKNEPLVRQVTMMLCHKQVLNREGFPDNTDTIWFWQRLAAPIMDLPPRVWEPKRAKEETV